MNPKIIEAVAVASEICGTTLSKPAARVFAEQLSNYDEVSTLNALNRCMRELKGRLTLSEVISRIDDGRPGVDEAWAGLAWDEESTAVITVEMEAAQSVAWSAYLAGDRVGARMAFKDCYTAAVTKAREQHVPVRWIVSLGWDVQGREGPIKDAMAKGRITRETAIRFLPEPVRERIQIGNGQPGLSAIGAIVKQIDEDRR
jgi:hypothetical protein